MFEINSKYGPVKVYAETIENEAVSQITSMANSPVGEDAHIRIMPDAHAGKGCTIGTTMKISKRVCPNLVGVDIGCGVLMVKTNIDFGSRLEELDRVIHERIPSGFSVQPDVPLYRKELDVQYANGELRFCQEMDNGPFISCLPFPFLDKLSGTAKDRIVRSIGTLGGGNHFIEAYEDGWIAVHTGSRNLGVQVCKYFQAIAETNMPGKKVTKEEIEKIPPKYRELYIKSRKSDEKIPKDLAYLYGPRMYEYLMAMNSCQAYATYNRNVILDTIIHAMGGEALESIESVHNYIDSSTRILRKGAISAQSDERCVIPLNMRDGVLICRGKGNTEWNFSAPHGAGRLYSRNVAKAKFTVDQYAESMAGIYTTCVNKSTLDEAPFVYKDMEEIMRCIEPTVTIEQRLKPIYNFKAN